MTTFELDDIHAELLQPIGGCDASEPAPIAPAATSRALGGMFTPDQIAKFIADPNFGVTRTTATATPALGIVAAIGAYASDGEIDRRAAGWFDRLSAGDRGEVLRIAGSRENAIAGERAILRRERANAEREARRQARRDEREQFERERRECIAAAAG